MKKTPDQLLMKLSSKKSLILSFVLGIFLIFSASYFIYSRLHDAQLKESKYLDKKERMSILDKVKTHILLPEGEEPTIAAVSDKSKLSSQSFFAKAENGDQILIYSKHKKAILYRPSIDKIIEVGPISIGVNL